MSPDPPAPAGSAPGDGADAGQVLEPVWLRGGAEPFPAFLHRGTGPGRVGVVMVPPFGWEEMSSYRPRRAWALRMAGQGHPVVRFDLPGTGDAGGGPWSPGRVEAWRDAVGVAVDWLRSSTAAERVVALGIGLGGLLAMLAVAGGAAIDDLVLWGIPTRGRAFARELRAFSALEAGQLEEEDRGRGEGLVPPGAIVAGGYALSAGTRAELEAVDVTELTLPAAAGRRALLLGRDGMKPDPRLHDTLVAQGVQVEGGPGNGYGRMLVEPQFARLPEEVALRVEAFLGTAAAPGAPATRPAGPVGATEAVLEGDPGVRERFVVVPRPGGDLLGVLAEPLGGPVADHAALLIGGTGHRIGPNRMWVEVARRWGALGVPTLRVDVGGAGDAANTVPDDVPGLYTPELVDQIADALRTLQARTGRERILAVGLCAGGYWALHAALALPFTVTPVMINLPTLHWDHEGHAERMTRHYREQLFRRETWRRLAAGQVSFTNAPRAVLRRARDLALHHHHDAGDDPALRVLDRLQERGLSAHLIFVGREALGAEFAPGEGAKADLYPNLTVATLPGRSDLHTLRPAWVQQALHAQLDAALAAELGHEQRSHPVPGG